MKVLLGVTGSVAAIHTRLLFDELRGADHQVRIVATRPALYFFDPGSLSESGKRDPEVVTLDEDEWPGAATGNRYARGDAVLHIELRRWADVLLVAPLDANTLAKLALGVCDNCLTCVYRAWDRSHRVLLAPAMNTLMWEHPATTRHLRQIAIDLAHGVTSATPPQVSKMIDLIAWINATMPNLRIVPPQVKTLACDDVGMGAMADRKQIIAILAGQSPSPSAENG